jgi:hypothetical protein
MDTELHGTVIEIRGADGAQRIETDATDAHLQTIWFMGLNRIPGAFVGMTGTLRYYSGVWGFAPDQESMIARHIIEDFEEYAFTTLDAILLVDRGRAWRLWRPGISPERRAALEARMQAHLDQDGWDMQVKYYRRDGGEGEAE